MDILRQLTRKFRAQDINDRSSSSKHSTSSSSSTTILQMKEDDVLDSGTASDEEEEVAGIFLPDSTAGAEHLLNNADELNEVPIDRDSNLRNGGAWNPVSTSAQRSPLTSINLLSTSSSPFSSFGHPTDAFPMAANDPPSPRDGRHSVTSSDYERCSLDFEASSSSELELHSSEEELATINRDEKRKRSQLSDDSSVFSDDDDEVHKLFRGQDELLFRSISVRLTEAPGVSSAGSEVVGPAGGGGGGGRGVSPRKRHRRDCWGMASVAHHHRPSLDFYKMQIVNGSQRPSKTTFDPSPFCFRSLSWTPRNTVNDSPHQTR